MKHQIFLFSSLFYLYILVNSLNLISIRIINIRYFSKFYIILFVLFIICQTIHKIKNYLLTYVFVLTYSSCPILFIQFNTIILTNQINSKWDSIFTIFSKEMKVAIYKITHFNILYFFIKDIYIIIHIFFLFSFIFFTTKLGKRNTVITYIINSIYILFFFFLFFPFHFLS